DRVLKINVGATNNLARACHLLERKTRFIFISSAEVYGRISPGDLPIREELSPNPANNYSLSKLMAEQVMRRYQQGGYVLPVIARPFNHIGPGQDVRFVASSFARQLAAISRGKNPPQIQVGNLSARRDFSDVRDIVRGYRLLAQKGEGIYNFGSGHAVPVSQVLDMLIKASGLTVSIVQDQSRMRAAEVPEIVGSHAKATRELGWKPEIALEQSLEDMFAHWVKVLAAES
ncbi:MAG: NAD-dependent epimerase/dehydratase family protein, partial [Proteobacteria bacterium]|nr:NAD-dependent epimerase/dehydratase family protein [Pseudomonadota bacterium]